MVLGIPGGRGDVAGQFFHRPAIATRVVSIRRDARERGRLQQPVIRIIRRRDHPVDQIFNHRPIPGRVVCKRGAITIGPAAVFKSICVVEDSDTATRRCCKVKNQTILGDSLGRQGGRRAFHDGYAPISSYRVLGPRLRTGGAAGGIPNGSDRYRYEDVSRMAGRTHEERRAVAERQECRDWPIPAEPAAEESRCQQEVGEGASEGEGNAGC